MARQLAGHDRIVDAGTYLDSLRFRLHIGERLGVGPDSVEANVVGEHGTSSVFLWSSARVGGMPVRELLARRKIEFETFRKDVEQDVRFANITIIEGIGASQYGIGMVCARIAEVILGDERAVIPVGSYNPRFGTTVSLPSIVGRQGVIEVLQPEMSDSERQGLERGAARLKETVSQVPQRVDVEQLRRRAAQHRHLLLVAERIAGEDVVHGLQLPGIGIVAAQHDLAGADLGREMADRLGREDQRIEVELLQVLRRLLLRA